MDVIGYALAQAAKASANSQKSFRIRNLLIPQPYDATDLRTDLPRAIVGDYLYFRAVGKNTFRRMHLRTRALETLANWPGNLGDRASSTAFNPGAMSVVIGTLIYVLCDNAFYVYDTVANTWTTKTAFPTNVPWAVSTDGTSLYAASAVPATPKRWNGSAWENVGTASFGWNTAGHSYCGDHAGNFYSVNVNVGCQVWDRVSGLITTKATPPRQYYGYIVVLDGYLYLLGGRPTNVTSSANPLLDRLNLATNVWEFMGNVPGYNNYNSHDCGSLMADGSILLNPRDASSGNAFPFHLLTDSAPVDLRTLLAHLASK